MSKPDLTELRPMKRNPRKQTPRGRNVLAKSLERNGLGRSVVAAADGSLIAGNQTYDTLGDVFDTDALEVVKVHTTGQTLVVVVRDDIPTADSEAGRRLALDDNRAGELGEYNPDILAQDYDPAMLADVFTPDELNEYITPSFDPVQVYQLPRLDLKKSITCPHCGKEFTPK